MMNHEGTPWTSEQDARLVELWNAGKSAEEVALAIEGKTRNAVVGRVSRLRRAGQILAKRDSKHKNAAHRRPRKPRAPKPQRAPKIVLKPIVDTLEGSVVLLDVTGCKWPVTSSSPHRFCNRDRLGNEPYCEGHLARAIHPEMRRGKYEVPFQ
jgi:hypothetical protein